MDPSEGILIPHVDLLAGLSRGKQWKGGRIGVRLGGEVADHFMDLAVRQTTDSARGEFVG